MYVKKVFCIQRNVLFTGDIHHCNTRHCNSFYLFPCRTNIRQFAISFQGPKLSVPLIQNAKLRSFLLNGLQYSCFKRSVLCFAACVCLIVYLLFNVNA